MRKRRGFTLVELVSSISILSLVVLGTMTFMMTGLRSFKRTDADLTITTKNALAVRKISESLRQAMSVTISDSGKTISFTLPAMTPTVNALTGERELIEPLTSDGVARSFQVNFATKTLTEYPSGRVLVRDLAVTDPQQGSSQYNQAYVPFQLTTIGSYRAVTINLITQKNVTGNIRSMRMKTTVLIRNSQ